MTSVQNNSLVPANTTVKETKNTILGVDLSTTSFAGLIGGSVAGIGVNLWNNASFFAKCIHTKGVSAIVDNGRCYNPLSQYDFNLLGQPVFAGLNHLKQEEIKKFAFAIPYAPLITDITATILSKTYKQGIRAGLKELKSRVSTLPMQELLTPVIACAIGVFARPYVGLALSSSNPSAMLYKFNPSGHVIAKLSSAVALYEAVDAVKDRVDAEKGSKKRLAAAALQVITIVATDALMMYHTGAIHHSAAEMVAGSLIFAAAYPLSSLVSKGICRASSSLASKIYKWAVPLLS